MVAELEGGLAPETLYGLTEEGEVAETESGGYLFDREICGGEVAMGIVHHVFANPFVGCFATLSFAYVGEILGRHR